MAKNLEDMTPAELKAQADALLAADAHKNSAAEKEVGKPAAKGGKKTSRKKSDAAPEEPMRLLTDEEAKKAGILRLDDKQVAALPAASWLISNEKLRELLAKGKKKGKKARKKAAKRARKRATERQIALANYRCGYLSAENDMLRKMIALSVGVKRGSFNDKLAADGLKLLPGGDR